MGTAGGTLLTVANVHSEELLKAVILSVVGAASSFVMSALLSWFARRFRKNRD
jgi:hypothetical protein